MIRLIYSDPFFFVFSIENGRGVKAGENVFIVRGEIGNPAADRAHMKTDLAVNTDIHTSSQQLESINQKQSQVIAMQQKNQQSAQQGQMQQQLGGVAMRGMV